MTIVFTEPIVRAQIARMSKGALTRSAIIDEALTQAVAIGLEGVSLGGVAERLELSKSGLFAHFKSKEALQIAVLERAIERFTAVVVAPALKLHGLARAAKLFHLYLDWIKDGAGTGGCLFVTAIQEFDDRPGPIRDLLVKSQQNWRAVLRQALREAIEAGELRGDAELDQLVFELVGASLAYQHSHKLLDDKRSRRLVKAAFARIVAFASSQHDRRR